MHAASAAAPSATETSQTPSAAQPKPIPDLNELEDVLFDLLSSGGIDGSLSHDKLEAIQAFLHEHARERKTHEQFAAFFTEHALPLQLERPNLLALPMVDARSRSARAPLLVDPAPDEPVLIEQPSPIEPAAISGKRRASAPSWLWALGFGAVAGLLALGIGAVVELRAELQQLRAEATHGALQVEQLRAETERLRQQLQDNAQTLSRTEHKAQLLLQTLAAPLNENSR